MKKYTRPTIQLNSDVAEGVFLHSGERFTACQSQDRQGIYKAPTGGSAGGGRVATGDRASGQNLGCQGCPADRNWSCKLAEDGEYTTQVPMPSWEAAGHSVNEEFTYNLD